MNRFSIRIFGAGLTLVLLWDLACGASQVFLNGSTRLLLNDSQPMLSTITSLTFRTCSNGTILRQSFGNDSISVAVLSNGPLELSWFVNGLKDSVVVGANVTDNQLHWVSIRPMYGLVWLHVGEHEPVLMASDAIRPYLLSVASQAAVSTVVAPFGFRGCLSGGANLILETAHAVGSPAWGSCPLPDGQHCKDHRRDPCFDYHCQHGGLCVLQQGVPKCNCTARYSGEHCEKDEGPLCDRDPWKKKPCVNGGVCVEDWRGNSTRCLCRGPWSGSACQEPAPDAQCDQPAKGCRNGGSCVTGSAQSRTFCQCPPGYAGIYCEQHVGECQLGLCHHGGVCTEGPVGPLCNCQNTGYRGPLCDEDVDECAEESVCLNGGSCVNQPGSFECVCPPGFGGPHCEQAVGPCKDNSPCMHNGTCQEVDGGLSGNSTFTCLCSGLHSGRHCEVPRAPCTHWSCTHGMQCRAQLWCGCLPGYREDPALGQCVRLSNCSSLTNPCLHGGTCYDSIQTTSLLTGGRPSYQCFCPDGFRGNHCELALTSDPCDINPCQNGATCRSDQWGAVCLCLPGYSGDLCELKDDLCVSSPCLNGGTCLGLVNDFVCKCERGWTGKRCDRQHDPCRGANPCLHGTCHTLLGGRFHCQCLPGYSGELCERRNVCTADCINGTSLCHEQGWQCDCQYDGETCGRDAVVSAAPGPCSSRPCANNATCRLSELEPLGFVCACPLGLVGNRCEHDVDECAGHKCPNGMQCLDKLRGYECRCSDPQGTCGSFARGCHPNPCVSADSVCQETDELGSFHCECPRGYQGSRCAEDVDECAAHICEHDGLCRNKPGKFECYCRPGYTGTRCHIEVNECLSQPCLNGATCVDGVNEYKCICPGGYLGDHCEIDFNECASSPCMHGATCLDQVNGFRCNCPAGYEGTRCEIDIDECQSGPCLNGAGCLDLVNGYECNCTDTGFEGAHCERNIDDCYPGACQHGGTCEDRVRGFHCHCHEAYEGSSCEIDIPDCDPPRPSTPPCENGAACLERSNTSLYRENYLGLFPSFSYATAAGYVCLCPPGFNGTRCENNIDDCPGHNCSVYGHCVDLVNAYRCECQAGYEGVDCATEVNECEAYQPCRNGATCHDKVADYECTCADGYGDKNCSTLLLGCRKAPCLNDARCEPLLTDDRQHSYRCHCLPGFAGNTCQTVTTASLNNESTWDLNVERQREGPLDHHKLRMQFRTTLPAGLLARVAMDKSRVLLVTLSEGHILVKSADDSLSVTVGKGLNNAEWNELNLEMSLGSIFLSLTEGPNATASLPGYDPATPLVSVVLGSGQSHRDTLNGIASLQKQSRSSFVGCLREVWLDGALQLPRDQVGMSEGCPREEQCVVDTCSGQGNCVDLWNQHECHCRRPYYGERCDNTLLECTRFSDRLGRVVRKRVCDSHVKWIGAANIAGMQSGVCLTAYFVCAACVACLQLNDRPIQLLKTEDPEGIDSNNSLAVPVLSLNVQNGVVGDDVCNNSQDPPCRNNGTCEDIWNAYECVCPPSYRGNRCEEVKPCVLNGCPEESTCQDLEQGFECVSSATFDADRRVPFRYRASLSSEPRLDSVSMRFRTRSPNGNLLWLASGSGSSPFFSLSLVDSQVEARWQFNSGEQRLRFGTNVTQGEWQELRLNVSNTTVNATLVPGDLQTLLRTDNGLLSLSNLLTYIVLAGDTAEVSSQGHGNVPFEGCLEEVRLGGILLPFFTSDHLRTNSTATWDRFELVGLDEPTAGCILCRSDQCAHGGSCQHPLESYVCVCPPAYEGERCELDVDECVTNPCLQGAPCINLDGGFRCDCPAGYTGKRCEERILYCSENNSPCKNGATCSEGEPGHFSCLCTDDFEGQNCTDRKVITCNQAPCQNNGMCYAQEPIGKMAYRCECEHGFEGTNCERARDFCESAPCLHGAACESERGGHRCICVDGYRGDNCGELIDYCLEPSPNGPCLHGGRCVPHVGGFTCDCEGTGYEGAHCETNVNECALEVTPCEHGSTCVDAEGSYKCTCTSGRFGRHCEHNDTCHLEEPCRNEAPCTPLAEGRFFCNCTPGYHGLTCALLVSSASLDSTDLKLVIGLTVACVFLLAFIVGATVFLRMAKKKRATRGTYSPSNQEMFGARVEMNPVMKPPPEERLI
ncbi:protein crumbs-like [Rhipicephalus sanguineus]|uniref:protein crumbs-like n=1 Tax=Rhipicephalus sanguineus TaxID=34632 RepID=UPI001893C319|nr:protein crumbs-like [Rhipicephalus sanguineus]